MATRADFYIGRGETATWIASVAFDGYPEGIQLRSGPFPEGKHLFDATTEQEFRERLNDYLLGRDDVTLPQDGWPWPWETSSTTDYAYAFDEGKVYASCFGSGWFDPTVTHSDESDTQEFAVFPNMSEMKRVTLGKRSGVIVFGRSGLD